jgi:hypothetical protein
LFHVDRHGRTEGQTEMRKLIVAFRNFTNALKNASVYKTKFGRCLPFLAVSRKSEIFVVGELQREGKILLDSLRY